MSRTASFTLYTYRAAHDSIVTGQPCSGRGSVMVPKETGAPAARQPLQCPICGTFVEMDLINPNGTDLSPKD